MSKQGWPRGASVAALCERARTLWEEADLSFLTACLPTSVPALAWFFKAFQGFFHSPRLNSECLKEEFLHGNSCWKTKCLTKLTFTTKSSDAWIIANATQDTIQQNSSALSLPRIKTLRVLCTSPPPLSFGPLAWLLTAIPGKCWTTSLLQGNFTQPKESPALKQ